MRARLVFPAALAMMAAQPAVAEVIATTDRGFVTRDEAVVDATTKEVWLALIGPSQWWNPAHTWSGDSENLSLRPQAGGCFCERIPEDPDPEKITLEGSVEHMRVIQSYPERALRMQGALGPLQSEPVTGILTIAISEVEDGTRIVWEYAVGGEMRFEIPVISKAVDGVMTQQLVGLATLMGPVRGAGSPNPMTEPEPEPEAEAEAEAEAEGEALDDVPADDAEANAPETSQDSNALDDFDLGDVSGGSEVVAEEQPVETENEVEEGAEGEIEEDSGPTVEEAFGDLIGDDVEGGT